MPRKARTYANECSIGCGGYHSQRHKKYRSMRRKNSERNLFIRGNAAPAIQRMWRARRVARQRPVYLRKRRAMNAVNNLVAAQNAALPAIGNVIA